MEGYVDNFNCPRYKSCCVFPYCTNENGEFLVLMREKESRYKDFGGKY
jgi:hypothetical protein